MSLLAPIFKVLFAASKKNSTPIPQSMAASKDLHHLNDLCVELVFSTFGLLIIQSVEALESDEKKKWTLNFMHIFDLLIFKVISCDQFWK